MVDTDKHIYKNKNLIEWRFWLLGKEKWSWKQLYFAKTCKCLLTKLKYCKNSYSFCKHNCRNHIFYKKCNNSSTENVFVLSKCIEYLRALLRSFFCFYDDRFFTMSNDSNQRFVLCIYIYISSFWFQVLLLGMINSIKCERLVVEIQCIL